MTDTKQIDDGGPAFPSSVYRTDDPGPQRGMTLRAWLAGQALVRLISNPNWNGNKVDNAALMAVEAADALIAALKGPKP